MASQKASPSGTRLLTALPPVIMYTLAQRMVIQGLTMGGVKG